MPIHGKATGILMGGYDLTSMLNSISTPQSLGVNEVTPFGSTAKTYIAGLADATVSMSGFFEGDATATEELLDAVSDSAEAIIVSYGRALVAGQDVKFSNVIRSAFEVSSPVGDAVAISGAAQADGVLVTGKLLAALQTISSSPTNGASQDGAASTSAGGKAVLQVTANTRNGDVTVKVQHSADNSTWADLATFTAVATTVVTSEVIVLPSTINRYTRVLVTLAGSSGSAIITVALSRG